MTTGNRLATIGTIVASVGIIFAAYGVIVELMTKSGTLMTNPLVFLFPTLVATIGIIGVAVGMRIAATDDGVVDSMTLTEQLNLAHDSTGGAPQLHDGFGR